MTFDDEVWGRLVDSLERWGAVREGPDGHLAVAGPRFNEARAQVIIVMTRGDWSDLVSIMYGASDANIEAAIRDVQTLVDEQPDHLVYLVYDKYTLVPSATPVLAPDPEFLALQELARQHPEGIPGGGWFAHPPGEPSSRPDA